MRKQSCGAAWLFLPHTKPNYWIEGALKELTWQLLRDWQQGLPGVQMFLQEWVFQK